jgi:hypothetical protein
MGTAKTNFYQNSINSQCDDYCPLECFSVSYSKSIHAATYPTSAYVSLLLYQKSFLSLYSSSSISSNLISNVQNSLAKINIYYNHLSYDIAIDTIAVTWDGLLGSLGGFIGLLIGISVLSLFEMFELVFECIRMAYNHRTDNQIKNIVI